MASAVGGEQHESYLATSNDDIDVEEKDHRDNIDLQCKFLMENVESCRLQHGAESKGLLEAKMFLENYHADPVENFEDEAVSLIQWGAIARHVQWCQ